MSTRIALVSCGSAKLELEDGETVPARVLYTSIYFSLKQEYATTVCDDWRILSAKHGLLNPETEIGPYDATLNPNRDAYIGDEEREAWSKTVADSLQDYLDDQADVEECVVLCSDDYIPSAVETTLEAYPTRYPFRSDELGGIGDQQGWLREQIDSWVEKEQSTLTEYDS